MANIKLVKLLMLSSLVKFPRALLESFEFSFFMGKTQQSWYLLCNLCFTDIGSLSNADYDFDTTWI